VLPTITLNNGTTLNATRYNAIGNLNLNGATLSQSATDSGNYEGYQFLGTVTVGGSTPSIISSGNGKANHLRGASTINFNVADVTGSAAADLTVSNPIRNGSGDYAGVGSLQKTGAGTMLLTAANPYTGSTTISAGTLVLGSTASLASSQHHRRQRRRVRRERAAVEHLHTRRRPDAQRRRCNRARQRRRRQCDRRHRHDQRRRHRDGGNVHARRKSRAQRRHHGPSTSRRRRRSAAV
jgi:autotransporter-associated beta strand protein